MRRLLAAATLAAAIALSGCAHGSGPLTADQLTARRAAGIADCPAATGSPVDGGLPAVSLECLGADTHVDLSRLPAGKPRLVVFWAQWCQPCRAEMPMLGHVLPDYAGRLDTLLVTTKETRYPLAIEFAQMTNVLAPQLVDPDATALASLGMPQGIPQSVLVDQTGRVVARHSGGWDEATLRAALAGIGLA